MRYKADMICLAGEATGHVIFLDDPLSFWGGFDPKTGIIVDRHHPQHRQCLSGKIIVLPATRGSGGTPGGIAEALRRNTGPAGIILSKPDINLTVGAQVAAKLYRCTCPIAVVREPAYQELRIFNQLSITADGWISARNEVRGDGSKTI